jgi:Ser/Thr protein kinase RdoA (MazF antagonist)
VFLEFVDDWNLTDHHLEHWFTAARRLAQLHARFAGRVEQLGSSDFLLRLDGQYLCDWAARALCALRRESAGLAGELSGVVDGYGVVAELIARQPPTLVHNDLAPKNVLADRSAHPARICFVDWEMAGLGCGVLDLVHLKHGLGPSDDREMCAAYCGELNGTGLLPEDPRERDALFAACELHQTLYRLAHLRPWNVPLARAAQWVDEARELFARACGADAPQDAPARSANE